jgi:hypothetical protein
MELELDATIPPNPRFIRVQSGLKNPARDVFAKTIRAGNFFH